MTKAIESIIDRLAAFDNTPESFSLELRLSLAELILQHLRRNGWSQSQLAKRAQMKEPFVSRVLHSEANCTLDTVGRLLFAFGIHGCIREAEPVSDVTPNVLRIKKQDRTNGETLHVKEATASDRYRITSGAT